MAERKDQKYFIELGEVFGRLTVIEEDTENSRPGRFWLCMCACGNYVSVAQRKLGTGHTQSCGCHHRDRAREANITHGSSNDRLYSIWSNMKTRCTWTSKPDYKHYGGRGISYHPSFETFEGFLAGIPDGYADHLELDRIDNDGHYEPGNLRWATRVEQMAHTRRSGLIPHPRTGDFCTWREIADDYGLSYSLLYRRVVTGGEDIHRAISRPARYQARLTETVVKDVKRALWSMRKKDVAIWYGVSSAYVSAIANGHIYAEVDELE